MVSSERWSNDAVAHLSSQADIATGARDAEAIAQAVCDWYSKEARDLPWRHPDAAPDQAWAVLVSEFMLQQTQAARVIPYFLEWMDRWPTPESLAASPAGDAVRAWGRLGYPRRALWLHRAAEQIVRLHGGTVPREVDELLALTGVGTYTARAVASFAYGDRHPVVDTNTRRVLARALHGMAAAGPPQPSDLDDMSLLLPTNADDARTFNAGAMELGAVICTARSPRCEVCPLAPWCQWRGAGFPDNAPPTRRQARFEGSDRQMRGMVMAELRHSSTAIPRDALLAAVAPPGSPRVAQARRALDTLLRDGLIVMSHEGVTLP